MRRREFIAGLGVLSNILVANGMLPVGDMTVRGRLKAAEIIGVGP